jgi:hypothetical protein
MSFDIATYQRISAKLDVEGIDFDSFRDQPLDLEALRCLRYMHDVENHTVCYLRDMLVTRAHRDPEITSFLTLWNYEEWAPVGSPPSVNGSTGARSGSRSAFNWPPP